MQQLSSVYKQHGLSTKGGLFTGCTATVGTVRNLISKVLFVGFRLLFSKFRTQKGRHGVWNMIYFGLFKTLMPVIVPKPAEISKVELNVKRFFLGCLCGTIGKLAIQN